MIPLLLIGCGNMGGALLSRWRESLMGEFSPLIVVDPAANIAAGGGVSQVAQLTDIPADFEPGIVVIAVKPQQMDELLPALAERFGVGPVYLSIAAGKTLSYYETYLGERAKVVRAMPNTPAMVGKGMTGLVGNVSLTPHGKEAATRLMDAVGKTLWLASEDQMNAVTAISGSGPAYFFYMLECLVEAGKKQGLAEDQAALLALQTCVGSADLAAASNASFAEQRRRVTSPKGTTEAAISVLEKDGALKKLIENAVVAAIARAKEL